jgi:amidase
VALGTQTAGSVLRPAAFCGVVGWKPSPRLIPRAGVKLNADTLDEVGLFAHTLADTAFVLSVLTGRPAWKELPAQGRTGAAPALGITATAHRNAATPAMLAALSSLEAHLAQRGARLVDLTWPRVFDGLGDAQKTIQVFETARALAAEYLYRRTLLSPPLVALIEQGYACSADEYAAALQLARGCAAAIDSLFGAADVLLAPSAPGIAPAGLSSTGDPIFNRAWQVLGCPAVNLPLPPSIAPWERDLPLGISVVARPGQDAALLGAAAWIEAALAG